MPSSEENAKYPVIACKRRFTAFCAFLATTPQGTCQTAKLGHFLPQQSASQQASLTPFEPASQPANKRRRFPIMRDTYTRAHAIYTRTRTHVTRTLHALRARYTRVTHARLTRTCAMPGSVITSIRRSHSTIDRILIGLCGLLDNNNHANERIV